MEPPMLQMQPSQSLSSRSIKSKSLRAQMVNESDDFLSHHVDSFGHRHDHSDHYVGGYRVPKPIEMWIGIWFMFQRLCFLCRCCKFKGMRSTKQSKHSQEGGDDIDYSSGESDSEFFSPFSMLDTDEKTKRVFFLWLKTFNRAKGAAIVIKKHQYIKHKIKYFGQLAENTRKQDDSELLINYREAKCVILPSARWKQRWNVFVSLLLVWTALQVPVKVSFFDTSTTTAIVFDTLVDFCFILDVILNFFSAIERRDGQIEVRHRIIAKSYLKSWFWIDTFSSIPFQLLELPVFQGSISSDVDQTKLLRLTRLPRLYRIIRILRLLKMIRLFKQSKQMRHLAEFLSLTSGATQILGVGFTVGFMTHIVSSFWFFIAKLDGFGPDTWVVRKGVVDETWYMQYLMAFYWAFQTLTTVGFGDVSAKTNYERIYALCWMILGIGTYSYTIGNMTNLIASMDTASEELQQKLGVLKEFKKRTQMPNRLFLKIKRHLENNQKSANNFAAQEKLLNDLPQSLRSQIIACTHGEIIEKIDFFKDKASDFLIAVMPELKPLKLLKGDILFQQKDHAEEIYLIKQGKVKLHVDINDFIVQDSDEIFATEMGDDGIKGMEARNVPFIAYTEGSYFGDSDIFLQSHHLERDSTAITEQECHFFVLSRDIIMMLKRQFSKEIGEMQTIAKKRKAKHISLIQHLTNKVQSIQREKANDGATKVDYELNLMLMDDFEARSSEYTSLESMNKSSEHSDLEDGQMIVMDNNTKLRKKQAGKSSIKVGEVEVNQKRDKFVRRKTVVISSPDHQLKGNKMTLLKDDSLHVETTQKPSELKRKELKQKQLSFLRSWPETVTNFQQNMQMLKQSGVYLEQMTQEIQQANNSSSLGGSMKKLGFLVEQIQQNNEQSNKCLALLLQNQS